MGYGLLGGLALIPAVGMGVIGVFSAGSGRRGLLLFSLCGLWCAGGAVLYFFTTSGGFFSVLCLGQAAAGVVGWAGALFVRFSRLGDPSHPYLPEPPPWDRA